MFVCVPENVCTSEIGLQMRRPRTPLRSRPESRTSGATNCGRRFRRAPTCIELNLQAKACNLSSSPSRPPPRPRGLNQKRASSSANSTHSQTRQALGKSFGIRRECGNLKNYNCEPGWTTSTDTGAPSPPVAELSPLLRRSRPCRNTWPTHFLDFVSLLKKKTPKKVPKNVGCKNFDFFSCRHFSV